MTRFPVILFFTLLCFGACKTTVKTRDACGDGFLDPGEACDGAELTVTACADLGYHLQAGPITCNTDCTLDLDVCSGRCGDGVILREAGEQCDGDDLDGQSCQNLGMGGGTLACNDRCRFDGSGCEVSAICGDSVIHAPFEDCEGQDLNEATCGSLGYHGGQLGCDQDCLYDLEPCAAFGRCGDDEIQELYGETCEGTELRGQTCEGLGYHGGQLLCGVDCAYDESGCAAVGRCGDGVIQGDFGETCDGTELGGFSCAADTDFHAGEAVCGEDCRLDLSACEATGFCGDGVLQGDYEGCDGAAFPGNPSCTLLGYHGNNQACTADCEPDLTPCLEAGQCGDGIRQQMYESCEGGNLGGDSCLTLGYYGGTLVCTVDCLFDLSSCEAAGMCGDGLRQINEDCDGSELGGATCLTYHYTSGTLACSSICTIDTSGCVE